MEEEWTRWFVAAGIPRSVAANYSKIFVRNRLKKSLLRDLDKATLVELGVTAVGDQLAILRAAKTSASDSSASSDEVTMKAKAVKQRITAPSEETLIVPAGPKRGKVAPDRDEIYHIRMPAGTTAKTRQILKVSEVLRREGLHTRGTTGVRKGGRSVSPISRDVDSRIAAMNRRSQFNQVSSTTSESNERLGVKGLMSDRLNKVQGGRIVKQLVVPPTASRSTVVQRITSATSRISATGSAAARMLKGGNIRVKLANEVLPTTVVTTRPHVIVQSAGRGGGRIQSLGAASRSVGGSRMRGLKRSAPVQYVTATAAANGLLDEEFDEYGDEELAMEEEGEVFYEDDVATGAYQVVTTDGGGARGRLQTYAPAPASSSVFQRLSSTGF